MADILDKITLSELKLVTDDMLPDLIHAFILEVDQAELLIPELANRQAWRDLEVVSHGLKSASHTFGAEALAELCYELEKVSRAREAPSETLLAAFDSAAKITRLQLKSLDLEAI